MPLMGKDNNSVLRYPKVTRILALALTIFMLASIIPVEPASGAKENIELTTPVGGEEWPSGSEKQIWWTVSSSGGFITVSLSTDSGKSYETLGSLTNRPFIGSGYYLWKIPPNLNSTECRIKVTWTDSLTKPITVLATDESDSDFTVEPDVVVKFKETPSRMAFGKYYLTTYDLYDPDQKVGGLKFTWRINDGSGWSSWSSINSGLDYYNKSRGWIWWSIPEHYESADGQIRVEAIAKDGSTVLYYDQSEPFDIISPAVTLIQPDGGVTMVSGDTYRIKWYMSQDPEEAVGSFWIRISYDGGSYWSYNHHVGMVDHYDWTVPSVSTDQMVVKVVAEYGEWEPYDEDISSSNNTIITSNSIPSITLDAPNPPVDGGLIIGSGEEYDIEWSLTGALSINSMKIYYSTDNGTSWTRIANLIGRFISPYTWTAPAVDTYRARVKIEIYPRSGDMKWVMSNHAFYIFDTIEFNRPPVVMDGEDRSTTEGTRLEFDGSSAYDPDGDYIHHRWTQVQPDFIDATIHSPENSVTDITFDHLTNFPVDFVIKHEVWDGYEHDDPILYNSTTYIVHVEPRPPVLYTISPDTGWEGTTVKLFGEDMMGAEILFGGEQVGNVPTSPTMDNGDPDHYYNFTLQEDVPWGLHDVSLRTLAGESSPVGEIEIFPSPEWCYEWGLGFTNPTKHTLNYPWDPTGTGRYRDAFGNQVYLTTWICIGVPYWTPWDGWQCGGYLVDEPFAPDPLAALFYGCVFHYMARYGECFGMSTTALQFYHGDLSVNDYKPSEASQPSDLNHTGQLKRHIEWRQGAQMSAEILNFYLMTLINSLVPSSDATGMGVWIAGVKEMIDNGQLGVATMICDEGAHAVVPYAYDENGDRIRFYVYDSNRPEYSDPESAISMCMVGDPYNDNPPYIEIDKSGAYWDWTFYSPGGTRWHSDVGLAYVPYSVINGDRTLPLSVEGLIHLLAGSAEVQLENEEGNVSGVSDNGSVMWGIEDSAPLPMFSGEGFKPQSYFLPDGNYTVHLKGNDTGKYNWSMINDGSSAFSIENAQVDEGSNDTVIMEYPDDNPYRGRMTYGSDDDHKEYNASIIHEYGPRVREFRIIEGELNDDGQHGDGEHILEPNADYTGITFTNAGGGPTTFDVEFRSNVFSDEEWNGSDRPDGMATAVRKNITVGPGENVTVKALDWLNLSGSLIVIDGESVPDMVSSLSISHIGTDVRLEWDPPLDDGGWPVLGYDIFKGNTSSDLHLLTILDGNSFTDVGVERGKTHFYEVRPFNALGSGEMTGAVSILIPSLTEPASPENFDVSEYEGSVNLTWMAPEDDGGRPLLGFILFRGNSSESLEKIAEPGPSTFEYRDTTVEAGGTYYYRLLAYNDVGQGSTTDILSVEIPDEETDEESDGDDDGESEERNWLPYIIASMVLLVVLIMLGYLAGKRNRGEGTPMEE